MHTHKTRRAVIGLVALLVLAACGSGDDTDSGDGAPISEQETTSSTEATTTTRPAEGPEEWVNVARDLNRRYFELLQNPDPAQLATLYYEGCDCWQTHYGTLEFLQAQGEHAEGAPAAVRWVRHEITTPETGLVTLTVKSEQVEPLKRVGADGEVVQTLSGLGDGCRSLTIRLDPPANQYRIYTEMGLNECPAGS